MEEAIRPHVVELCVQIHTSVATLSQTYRNDLRRYYYVTPTSYLELIATFKELLCHKRLEVSRIKSRYDAGLEKLAETSKQISSMQVELEELTPVLKSKTAEAVRLIAFIETQSKEAEATRQVVQREEEEAQIQAANSRVIRDECEAGLEQALPTLREAEKALKGLNKNQISEIKAMKKPPQGVRLVMETVCILLGVKPSKQQGSKEPDYWTAAMGKHVLGDPKLLKHLLEYDKDSISPDTITTISGYVAMPDFDPAKVYKSSVAAHGLCLWVRAMHKYYFVARDIKPKRMALKQAEDTLQRVLLNLQEKKEILSQVELKIAGLTEQLARTEQEKALLANQVDGCEKKIDRANRLMSGLGGEKQRWTDASLRLSQDYDNLIGDVLVSSGLISYMGAFTLAYRNQCVNVWRHNLISRNVPTSTVFSLTGCLGNQVKIRDWIIHDLPSDSFSVDNAIIVDRSRRCPLMIDPQGQANKWIKNMEKSRNLLVMKLTESQFTRTLENGVQFGTPILIEGVAEELDPVLDSILLKQTFKQSGREVIRIGDSVVEYSSDFRLYLSTRQRNPHYLPELCVKVCLLNFMITPEGLQDQMLGLIVAKERPDLEEKRNDLIVKSAENKKTLQQLEDTILDLLYNATNLLEDETLITTLAQSKKTSEDMLVKIRIAESTETKINEARAEYIEVSTRASSLFFCISELCQVDPMYQYSLSWFIRLFLFTIESTPRAAHTQRRLADLNDAFVYNLYSAVCRSLFEKDKLLLSFLLCLTLSQTDGELDHELLTFLLTGSSGLTTAAVSPNPSAKWLSQKSWSELVQLNRLGVFAESPNLLDTWSENEKHWKLFHEDSNPQKAKLPTVWDNRCIGKPLARLCLVRAMRPDKVVPAVQEYVRTVLDQRFIEPPPFDLSACYKESTAQAPLVFILSPGADPVSEVFKLADQLGMTKKLNYLSLGQGQGEKAVSLIKVAIKTGGWVLLQNCHLATSFMPELERTLEELEGEKIHNEYRLWLTSMPSEGFPVSILQTGIKMTNEPPRGLRANLLRSYLSMDRALFDSCPNKSKEFKKLLFSLCFFHAVVQERRKFGPLGWNIRYEFSETDLKISALQLPLFLNNYIDVPYNALLYLTGHANYGGRVTDDKDRKTLLCLLEQYYTPRVMEDEFRYSSSDAYCSPPEGDIESYLAYIRQLPLNDAPEVFGLHENADISRARQEASELLGVALTLQPKAAQTSAPDDSSTAASTSNSAVDKKLEEMVVQLTKQTPAQFDIDAVQGQYPIRHSESMNTVLQQELMRFNKLLWIISTSLTNLSKALKGLVVMSPELETVLRSIQNGQVPAVWMNASYPSLKPLGSYMNDLSDRCQFMTSWIHNGPPPVFWFSGLFFPQAFLTGTLQNFARREHIPIDMLGFDFEVLKYSEKPSAAPAVGCYIRGLHLEGGKWSDASGQLEELDPKQLVCAMPVVWLKPLLTADLEQFNKIRNEYHCPVYKTSRRAGTLSTTGHSTNFVLNIMLPSPVDTPPAHWVKRGTALLCQLDD
eukprot:GILK01006701.1.p1 GENE.GILK01006701.1~~GILK01006701.1.p1  ORF type:complete len:1608 (-),score=254.94 GILK01006701.1:104-4669(-)